MDYKKKHKEALGKQGEQDPYGQIKKCINCQFIYTGYCNGTCILESNNKLIKPL